jgi:hypothetical protein
MLTQEVATGYVAGEWDVSAYVVWGGSNSHAVSGER